MEKILWVFCLFILTIGMVAAAGYTLDGDKIEVYDKVAEYSMKDLQAEKAELQKPFDVNDCISQCEDYCKIEDDFMTSINNDRIAEIDIILSKVEEVKK